MKRTNFYVITVLAAVMNVVSVSVNAQVMNHQTRNRYEVQTPQCFWVGRTFFEWNGEQLIVSTVHEDEPVILAQPVLQKDGSFTGTYRRNIHTAVYDPVNGWKNENSGVISSGGRPEAFLVAEKTYTEYVNYLITTEHREVTGINGFTAKILDCFLYDVKVEEGRVSLRIHTITYADGEEIGDKTLFRHTYVRE